MPRRQKRGGQLWRSPSSSASCALLNGVVSPPRPPEEKEGIESPLLRFEGESPPPFPVRPEIFRDLRKSSEREAPSPPLSPPFLSEPFSAFRLGRGDRPAPASPTLPPTPIPGFRPCWETNEKMEIGSLSPPFPHARVSDRRLFLLPLPPDFPDHLTTRWKKGIATARIRTDGQSM